jgi:hypothetical protein
MSTPSRPKSKQKTAAPSPDLGPADSLAHEIVAHRADLRPSVQRIVSAGMSAGDTEHALGLFQQALSTAGDPNRDPRVAIESSRGGGR